MALLTLLILPVVTQVLLQAVRILSLHKTLQVVTQPMQPQQSVQLQALLLLRHLHKLIQPAQ